jgi:hypothetical protein
MFTFKNMTEKFGLSQADEKLEKILLCREIVKRIIDVGLSQEQILTIIQLLGYELENHDQMLEVVGLTKELLGSSNKLYLTE